MAIERILYRQFAGSIEDEILWRLRQDHNSMNKVHIEEVGQRISIEDHETAIGIFLLLADQVWAGELLPEEGPPITVSGPRIEAPPWTRVAFDRDWFQEQGKLPTSESN